MDIFAPHPLYCSLGRRNCGMPHQLKRIWSVDTCQRYLQHSEARNTEATMTMSRWEMKVRAGVLACWTTCTLCGVPPRQRNHNKI